MGLHFFLFISVPSPTRRKFKVKKLLQPPGKSSCGQDPKAVANKLPLLTFLGKFCLKISGLGLLTFPRLTWNQLLTCPVLNMNSLVRKIKPLMSGELTGFDYTVSAS